MCGGVLSSTSASPRRKTGTRTGTSPTRSCSAPTPTGRTCAGSHRGGAATSSTTGRIPSPRPRRRARADDRARRLLQPGLGKEKPVARRRAVLMGGTATFSLLADVISSAQNFLNVFVGVYSLVILLYIITSWLRLPYSPWLNRIQ